QRQWRGTVAFIDISRQLTVASFVGIVPAFFQELRKMHEAGTLKAEQFCLAADATFKVEVDQWVYTVLIIPAYRKLQGYWRQSRWPVLLLRRTKERFQCYRLAFRAGKEELARLKLPPLRQVHCDYFPGLPRVVREELQEAESRLQSKTLKYVKLHIGLTVFSARAAL
ncbi:unnamed protein product, partial [Effrenium voratum]